jgi:hypothetical protein
VIHSFQGENILLHQHQQGGFPLEVNSVLANIFKRMMCGVSLSPDEKKNKTLNLPHIAMLCEW